MTAISAIIDKKNGVTFLASDKLSSNTFTGHISKTKKIFKNCHLSIAICGSWRVGLLLQHKLRPRDFYTDETVDHYVHDYLTDEISKLLTDNGVMAKKDDVREIVCGEYIFAIRDRLFILQEDMSFLEREADYVTSGSGYVHQEASIATQLLMKPDKKKDIILIDAIAITSKFVVSVGGGVDILEHKHK